MSCPAVQIDYLRRLKENAKARKRLENAKGVRIIMVHAVNPYGMAWLRKFNENNVDLNRNFHLGSNRHEDMLAPGKRNKIYPTLHGGLVPAKNACCDCFYCFLGYNVCRYGYGRAKQGLASGQYEFKNGLFYGGLRLEPGPQMLVEELATMGLSCTNKELFRVLHVDVHTGLGAFGQDLLLFDDSGLLEPLRAIFGSKYVADPNASDTAIGTLYETAGSCDTLAKQLLANAPSSPTVLSLCQEFGTLNGISVLRAMINEGAWWHANRSTKPKEPVKQALLRAFYPDCDKWRASVLHRGAAVFEQGISYIIGE